MRIGFALAVILLWVVMAFCGLWLELGGNLVNLPMILSPPGLENLLGADDLGRSLAARLVGGAAVSLFVAVGVTAGAMLTGTLVGMISGYVGGRVDLVFTAVMDVFLAFPGLLLAIALVGVLGPGIDNLVIALVIVGWIGFARLARAQVLSLKQREHVVAARALGSSTAVIYLRHLLPLLRGPLIVEATYGIAAVIIAEAGLSFLGLGIQPPDPSWGSMIRDGTRYMLVAPHFVVVPGIALSLVVLAVNMAGDWLRDRNAKDALL